MSPIASVTWWLSSLIDSCGTCPLLLIPLLPPKPWLLGDVCYIKDRLASRRIECRDNAVEGRLYS